MSVIVSNLIFFKNCIILIWLDFFSIEEIIYWFIGIPLLILAVFVCDFDVQIWDVESGQEMWILNKSSVVSLPGSSFR